MTAQELITRSIEHNEIVHAPHSPELHDALLVVSDDYVENGPTFEFWGEDDDGNEWRVHLDRDAVQVVEVNDEASNTVWPSAEA